MSTYHDLNIRRLFVASALITYLAMAGSSCNRTETNANSTFSSDAMQTSDTSQNSGEKDAAESSDVSSPLPVRYAPPDLSGDHIDTVVPMPGSVGVQPAVAVSANGTPVVVFSATPGDEGDLGIYASVRGQPTFPLGITPAGQRNEPAVCRLTNDDFVAVWSYDGQAIGNPLGVEGAVFSVDGTIITNFAIDTEVEGNHWLGHVGCNPDSGFTVVGSRTDTDGTTFGIFAQHFDNDGVPLKPAFAVNPSPEGTQVQPVVGLGTEGTGVVIYEERLPDGNYTLMGRPINFDGNAGDSFTLLAADGVDCQKPAIAIGPEGRVAYAGNMGPQIQTFNVTSISTPEPSSTWYQTFGDYLLPAITFVGDDSLLAMASLQNMTDSGDPSVRVEIIEDKNVTVVSSVRLGDDPNLPPYPPAIGYGEGTLAVAWTQRTDDGFQVHLSSFKGQPVMD